VQNALRFWRFLCGEILLIKSNTIASLKKKIIEAREKGEL
jgi:hypothetical protein